MLVASQGGLLRHKNSQEHQKVKCDSFPQAWTRTLVPILQQCFSVQGFIFTDRVFDRTQQKETPVPNRRHRLLVSTAFCTIPGISSIMLREFLAVTAISASSAAHLRDSYTRDLASIEGVVGGTESSATGGHVFAMKKIRTYEGPRLSVNNAPSAFPRPEKLCEKWAVLTSIFDPTETVTQLGSMSDWCVVVVGDKKGPVEYDVSGVTYLTPADQEELPYRIGSMLPWNHFGRKNIGYLYAVHHGAKVIYDVDDDNALIRPEYGVPHADRESQPIRFSGDASSVVHNPYACFGGPGNVWPRGFPLDAIKEAGSRVCNIESTRESRSIGVIQALANHDPDVDAIYRLTYPPRGLPFDFNNEATPSGESPLRVVPDSGFTPYNAQATLHFEPAFWGMLLPVTVHGRVSDIWRSYFTQALLPATGGVVAFSPPSVAQVRNAHNYMADFQAELPLYQQSGALVAFLADIRRQIIEEETSGTQSVSLPERVEALAVMMYEYGILEYADVGLSQAWLEDLYAAGYCKDRNC